MSAFWQAVIYGALGENDQAFDLLEVAHQEHAAWMAYAKVAPFFDDLRSDRRFGDLLLLMSFP